MPGSIAAHLRAVPCSSDEDARRLDHLDLVTGRAVSVHKLMMGCAFVNSKRGEQVADEQQARATVAAAIAAGIRDFDTAPFYGPSEQRVGMALADASAFSAGGYSNDLRIWTKVGVVRDGSTVAELGATSEGARTSFEESTGRLGVARLAGLRFHDIPDQKGLGSLSSTDKLIHAAAKAETGMIAGIVSLKKQGLVGEVSIGMNASGGRRADWKGGTDGTQAIYGTPEQIIDLIRAVPAGTFDSLLMASGWNLLCQDGAIVLRECTARGIAVHNAGTFATGLLAGGYVYLYREAPDEMVAKTAEWAALCERFSWALPAVAMAFSGLPGCVEKVVIGCSSPSDVEECVAHCCAGAAVPKQLWLEAQQLGLLPHWLTFL